MLVVEGGNVLHHVGGIVQEGKMSGGIYPGKMSGSSFERTTWLNRNDQSFADKLFC